MPGVPRLRRKDRREALELNAQTAWSPGPISYELDGQQYVAVSVGGSRAGRYFAPNYSRLLVFTLGGKAVLPPTKPYTPPPLDPPAGYGPGRVVGGRRCSMRSTARPATATTVQTRGRHSRISPSTPLLHTQEGFDKVVLKGARAEKGMDSFAKDISPADAVAVREYLIARANALKTEAPGAAGPPAPPAPRRDTGHADN